MAITEEQDELEAREPAVRPAQLAERWLVEAYELVERGWCCGATAEDEVGRAVDPASDEAVRWSAAGALLAVWRRSGGDDEIGLRALQIAHLAVAAAVKDIPTSWNDALGRRRHELLEGVLVALSLVLDPVLFGNGDPPYGTKRDEGEQFGLEETDEPQSDPAEPWEPPIPHSPLGPEGVPKEGDPGPDA